MTEIIDRKELTERLSISVGTVQKLEAMGMPTLKATGFVRYDWEDVIAWLKDNHTKIKFSPNDTEKD